MKRELYDDIMGNRLKEKVLFPRTFRMVGPCTNKFHYYISSVTLFFGT